MTTQHIMTNMVETMSIAHRLWVALRVICRQIRATSKRILRATTSRRHPLARSTRASGLLPTNKDTLRTIQRITRKVQTTTITNSNSRIIKVMAATATATPISVLRTQMTRSPAIRGTPRPRPRTRADQAETPRM